MSENRIKLSKFVADRLAAAEAMPPVDAYWFCHRWAEYVEEQLHRFSAAASGNEEHAQFVGLTAPDLVIAHGDLYGAALDYQARVKNLLAA